MKKIILTNKEIEKDIATAMKFPSRRKYTGAIVGCLIMVPMIALIVLFADDPALIFLSMIAFGMLMVAYCILEPILFERYKKRISVNDYDISTSVVRSTDAKRNVYGARDKMHLKYDLLYGYIYFENGKKWRIPIQNYLWSENAMSDWGIYENTHRGDEFITVSKKKTGKIVVAYNKNLFEYKEK